MQKTTRTKEYVSVVHEQLDEPAADPGVDDRLDLFIGAVRQVGESPARIGQHIWITAEQQPGQNVETRRHLTNNTDKGTV